jgi:hypothetical protein
MTVNHGPLKTELTVKRNKTLKKIDQLSSDITWIKEKDRLQRSKT